MHNSHSYSQLITIYDVDGQLQQTSNTPSCPHLTFINIKPNQISANSTIMDPLSPRVIVLLELVVVVVFTAAAEGKGAAAGRGGGGGEMSDADDAVLEDTTVAQLAEDA